MGGAEADAIIVADDLSLGYGRRASLWRDGVVVDGLTLTVRRGEVLGLIGETGSGKSTVARAFAARVGGRRHDPVIRGGALRLFGRPMHGGRGDRRVARTIGYLPQQAGRLLPVGYTVAEIVAEPLFEADRRLTRADAGRRAAEVIDAVQLPLSILDRFAYELSAGQRQRVALARSLVTRPALWIADEPTAGVDRQARHGVLSTVLELCREPGFTAVIVSHEAAVTGRLTDRVAVLHRGILVADGAAGELLARPAHPYLAELARSASEGGRITVPVQIADPAQIAE